MGTEPFERHGVRGWIHSQGDNRADAIVLTHGAGSDCNSPLLVALAEALAERSFIVTRVDLAYRQARAKGPPPPGSGEKDRASLANAAGAIRKVTSGRVFLGGHSYGGRMATVLAAENPLVCDALLLLSYPLHPPGKPHQQRTSHFPSLKTPALFVHGTNDPFASSSEMREALSLAPARTVLLEIPDAGHDLGRRPALSKLAVRVAEEWTAFIEGVRSAAGD
ncbi:MAG: alpha/beta fold hydrolase [Bryobacteraceae bacterium]|nr:alpha/beta fold hydrolase [Bryobacteraceae bacterium]